VDVNWLKVGVGVIILTTMRRGGSAVLGFLLGDVGRPVLLHHRAVDDVEHRVLHVLLDQSTESGVMDRWRVDGSFILVGISPRDDLRTMSRKTRGSIRNLKFGTNGGEGAKIRLGVTHREELAKV